MLPIALDAMGGDRAPGEIVEGARQAATDHGIPILLKGNIDTGDRMQTTAGSFGLKGAPAPRKSR